jgi:hypothetical protein
MRYEDHLGYGLRNSAIAEHAIREDHDLGPSTLIKEISKPQFLDAAESLFICMHRENENCVDKKAPPIESRLFNLININKRGIDHQ